MSGVLLIEYDIMTNVHPCFCGVRVARSLVLCVCFVDRCLSFCTFSFDCVVCPSFVCPSVLFFGHCVVCPIVLSVLLAIVLSVLPIVLSVFWPLCCLSFLDL